MWSSKTSTCGPYFRFMPLFFLSILFFFVVQKSFCNSLVQFTIDSLKTIQKDSFFFFFFHQYWKCHKRKYKIFCFNKISSNPEIPLRMFTFFRIKKTPNNEKLPKTKNENKRKTMPKNARKRHDKRKQWTFSCLITHSQRMGEKDKEKKVSSLIPH